MWEPFIFMNGKKKSSRQKWMVGGPHVEKERGGKEGHSKKLFISMSRSWAFRSRPLQVKTHKLWIPYPSCLKCVAEFKWSVFTGAILQMFLRCFKLYFLSFSKNPAPYNISLSCQHNTRACSRTRNNDKSFQSIKTTCAAQHCTDVFF